MWSNHRSSWVAVAIKNPFISKKKEKENKTLVTLAKKITGHVLGRGRFRKKVTDYPVAKHFDGAQRFLYSKYCYYLYDMAFSISGQDEPILEL